MASHSEEGVERAVPVEVGIERTPVEQALVVDGDPSTGWALIGAIPGIEIGVWEHTVGTSRDVEEDEAFVVVSGRATVTVDDGESYEFGAGDIGILREGTHTTWIVHETLRKVFFGAGDA
jgi:uncharacterized cupin superfamily protein